MKPILLMQVAEWYSCVALGQDGCGASVSDPAPAVPDDDVQPDLPPEDNAP